MVVDEPDGAAGDGPVDDPVDDPDDVAVGAPGERAGAACVRRVVVPPAPGRSRRDDATIAARIP